MHKRLSRRKSLILQRLWWKYREAHPDGYGYRQPRELYRVWNSRRRCSGGTEVGSVLLRGSELEAGRGELDGVESVHA